MIRFSREKADEFIHRCKHGSLVKVVLDGEHKVLQTYMTTTDLSDSIGGIKVVDASIPEKRNTATNRFSYSDSFLGTFHGTARRGVEWDYVFCLPNTLRSLRVSEYLIKEIQAYKSGERFVFRG